jgi:hypothetical protein
MLGITRHETGGRVGDYTYVESGACPVCSVCGDCRAEMTDHLRRDMGLEGAMAEQAYKRGASNGFYVGLFLALLVMSVAMWLSKVL